MDRAGYSQSGKYYDIADFTLNPPPVAVPGRPHPEVFFGGNSTAAQRAAGHTADWYFSNGRDLEGFKENIAGVTRAAAEAGRHPRFGLNGFVIARDSEREARETLREIVAKAHRPAVEGFASAVKEAGQATAGRQGHVGGLDLRGPRAVQRRLPHPADRHAGADRRAGSSRTRRSG